MFSGNNHTAQNLNDLLKALNILPYRAIKDASAVNTAVYRIQVDGLLYEVRVTTNNRDGTGELKVKKKHEYANGHT